MMMSWPASIIVLLCLGTPSSAAFLFTHVRRFAVSPPLNQHKQQTSSHLLVRRLYSAAGQQEGQQHQQGQRLERFSEGQKYPKRPHRRGSSADDYLEDTKWGKIQSPHLFELFDPSIKSEDSTAIIHQRTAGLAEVKTERILTSILNSWAKADYAPDAGDRCHEVVEHMRKYNNQDVPFRRDVFLYNVVINAYAKRNQAEKAETILKEMLLMMQQTNHPEGFVVVVPDVRSFNSVINAWSKSDHPNAPDRCKRLLAYMIKMASSRRNKMLAPNTITYNTVIDAYARRGQAKEAEAVLRDMVDAPGVEPDVRSIGSVMNAWSKSDAHDAPEQCKRLLVDLLSLASTTDNPEVAPNTVTYNIVIDAFAGRGRAQEAEEVLRAMMRNPGVDPDLFSFNSVVHAWSKSTDIYAADHCRRLLADMIDLASLKANKKLTPDAVTYTTVIHAYASRGRAEEAEEVLREMVDAHGVDPDVRSFCGVMNAWSKSDSDDAPEQCKRLLDELIEKASSTGQKNLEPNIFAYTNVIDAFARRGRAIEAEDMLARLLNAPDVEPSILPYNSVLSAWSKSDADNAPERCRQLLDSITRVASEEGYKNGLVPDIITFKTVIATYASRGRAEEAEQILRELLDTPGVEPDYLTFCGVMNAWSKSDALDGPQRCRELLALMNEHASLSANKELLPNIVAYNIVIDAYARRGHAKEAEDFLQEVANIPGVVPNEVSFTSVTNAWSESDAEDAPEHCRRLLAARKQLASYTGNRDLAPDAVAYATAIDAFAVRGRAEEAEEVLKEMMSVPGVEATEQMFKSIMDAWSKSGTNNAPERSKLLLEGMIQLR